MSRARVLLTATVLIAGAAMAAATAFALDPITWRTMDCGGVSFVTAGNLRLGATIGQADAGRLSGGAFTLRGGFWTGGQSGALGVEDGAAPPLAFRFLPAWPNPVHARSRLAFDLPRASRATLTVFDVSGRTVRRVDYGVLPAGRHERAWNADDERGRALASGVYFLRLETERDRGVHRVVVMR